MAFARTAVNTTGNFTSGSTSITGITPEQDAELEEIKANTRATFAQVSKLTN